METFFIINQIKNRNAIITSVEFEKDDTKIVIENFIGYKITIEKIKGEEHGKKKISKKESR